MSTQIAFNDSVLGVGKNQDLNPSLVNRDVRPLRYRISEALISDGGKILVAIGFLIAVLPILGGWMQWVSDALIAFMLPAGPIFFRKNPDYPYRTPILPDKDAMDKDDDDGGMFFLGNSLDDGSANWISNSDMRTHMLVFGSTGSGKTRFLLGMLYQALLVGSGAMYVDGKGDNTVFWLAYTLTRRLGRDDDLLVINYLVGSKKKDTGSLKRISNTSNMLAYGDAEQLRSLIVGLMREAGGDGAMWKGRASAMLQALFTVLCYLRDEGEINLDVDKLRESMPLDTILRLYQRKDLPATATTSLERYLADLPGFSQEDAMRGQLQGEAYKQHGFLMMQLTEVLADLSDTYGHIFSAPMGEVDFKDVVFNRRILFVMLPALQKDPDALAGLGKMVVAGVRAALAPALGDEVEGAFEEVIAAKPANSKVPFLIILDEYGYYAVNGFAVVAAQARSLGVAVIFAGQDYPSFKKSSEEEAASTVANTNSKLCMKMEDAKETAEIMITRAGDAKVVITSGHEKKDSAHYRDNLQTRVDEKKRFNIRDLTNQKPGMAHMIFADRISRMQLFFADPKNAKNAQLNRFLMVDKPSAETLNRIKGAYETIDARLSQIRRGEVIEEDVSNNKTDEGILTMIEDMKLALNRRQSVADAALYAVGASELRTRLNDKEQAEGIPRPVEKAEAPGEVPASNEEGGTHNGTTSIPDHVAPSEKTVQETPAPEPKHNLTVIEDENAPVDSVADQANRYKEAFMKALKNTSLERMKRMSGRSLTAKQESEVDPMQRIVDTAVSQGTSEQQAGEMAERDMGIVSERVSYIEEPVPVKLNQSTLEQRLRELKRQTEGGGEDSFF